MDKYMFYTGIGGAAILFLLVIIGTLLAVFIPNSIIGVSIIGVCAAIGIVFGILAVVGVARRI